MNSKRLPDAYRKDTESNNYKMLNLNELLRDAFKVDMDAILNSLDLQKATGSTLDLFGDTVNQKRGVLNDEQYRYVILSKVGRNICQGDYNSVLLLLTNAFKCEANDIAIRDVGNGKVEVVDFPLEILINAGFSSKQAIQLIEQMLPAGVSVSDANFEGTFAFADSDSMEYDEEAGFGDISQTVGGYLGLVLDDENGFELPI